MKQSRGQPKHSSLGRRAVAALQRALERRGARYRRALGLSLTGADAAAEAEDALRRLSVRLAVSEVVHDAASGSLRIRGWCLSPEPEFDLYLSVSDQNLVWRIKPGTEARPDVLRNFPQYAPQDCGFAAALPAASLASPAEIALDYVSRERRSRVVKPVVAAPAAESARLSVDDCAYSPMRSLIKARGALAAPGWRPTAEAPRLAVFRAGGLAPEGLRQNWEATKDGEWRWTLSFPAAGVLNHESLTIRVEDLPQATAQAVIQPRKDSPGRLRALTPSAVAAGGPVEEALTAAEVFDWSQAIRQDGGDAVKTGTVCYFPPFERLEDLESHRLRAAWYLTGAGSPITRIVMAGPQGGRAAPTPREGFARERLDAGPIEVAPAGEAYRAALAEAGAILVWRPIAPALATHLAQALDAFVIPVATHDPAAVEYGSYCRPQWLLADEAEKARLLEESRERFRGLLAAQREAGKTAAAVFGTGPSLDQATTFDFSNCMSVVCNSIVRNAELMEHISPALICAGDAVSHFGVSAYAETFRRDLARALSARDAMFLTSAATGYLLTRKHPELADRIILCEQGFNGINVDLETIWALPSFDSTLNIHMLPAAASFSDTIYMLGFDGRSPDPEANEDFWAHSRAAQYHDLVDTGHEAHPTFAANRALATETRFLASVEESFLAAEARGARFLSLADSHTPAVRARPAPEIAVAEEAGSGPRALTPLRPAHAPGATARALVVMRVNRRSFSGGRYHASLLAEALARFCREVVVWADNAPKWLNELTYGRPYENVRYQTDEFLEPPEGAFDYIVIVPDFAETDEMQIKALEVARRSQARTVLLNFESPNWFNALAPAPRPLEGFDIWYAAASFCDVILSSCETARRFAEEFYRTPFHTPRLAACPPSINSAMADRVAAAPPAPEKQIILINRFDAKSAHKNFGAAFDVLPEAAAGHTMALLAGTAERPDEATLETLRVQLAAKGVAFKLLHMISDRAKYEEIARSRLMVFPSLFEGFGYPPVEAAYFGVPCVAYDLPVLSEFDLGTLRVAPWGEPEAMRAAIAAALTEDAPRAAPPGRSRFTHEAFSTRLRAILEEEDDGARAADRFTPEKFAFARRFYRDSLRGERIALGALDDAELSAVAETYAAFNDTILDILRRRRALGAADRP